MVWRLCQLKSLLTLSLLVFLGCAKLKSKDHLYAPRELLSDIPSGWMAINSSHSLWGPDEKPEPHLFFDFIPEPSKDKTFLNMVITTPQDSPYAYRLDTKSGQRFYSHSYCAQKDAWNKRGGTYERPIFSQGYVPRILDQLGEPQKIIVLKNRVRPAKEADRQILRVRIVGAYVEGSCPHGSHCLNKENWVSRLVLVAVDPLDKRQVGVSTVGQVKKKYDWDEVQTTLENIDGRSFVTDRSYPAVKVSNLLSYEEALKYLRDHTVYISDKEMIKIAKGCHALYDKIWNEMGSPNTSGFSSLMAKFTQTYFKEITTCEKFVYHGNINKDREKFWFLSYIMMFYRLHLEGHYFDCNRRAWHGNILNDEGRPVHDLLAHINQCDDEDMNFAMDYLPKYLLGLKGSSMPYYRFIEYDNHYFGSHRKMYSWVRMDARKFECSENPNLEILKKMQIFPDDVRWKSKYTSPKNGEKKNP